MRAELINHLIRTYGYETYLEIGLANPERNFNHIVAPHKESVDPKGKPTYRMKSDDFFKRNKKTYDIIFVDGLHLWQQAKRDIENSLNVLNENGIIVVHDTNPECEEIQRTNQNRGRWTGDVWKAVAWLRMTRIDLTIETVKIETGCSLIYPGYQELIAEKKKLEYQDLENNRELYLNLITWDEFLTKYQ